MSLQIYLTLFSINIDGEHGDEKGNLGTDNKSKKKKSKKRTSSDLDIKEMPVDTGKQDVL